MVKCFVTGDNHFGRPFEGELLAVRDKLIEARYKSLQKMVDKANEEGCDLFLVTGDLFEKTFIEYIGDDNKKKGEEVVRRVASILADFRRTVLVLPGNHDYFDNHSTVWQEFKNKKDDKIILLNTFSPVSLGEIKGNPVVIYPYFCQSEHSSKNNLDKINTDGIEKENTINIGMAHGTLEGKSLDYKNQYFKMSEEELLAIPMDAWFIGHAHVAYPKDLEEDSYKQGHRIFNVGTHQQIHIANNTEGYGFIVEIEKTGNRSTVKAKKWHSGIYHFYEVKVHADPDSENALSDALEKELDKFDPETSIIRVHFDGMIKPSEYERKDAIYQEKISGRKIVFTYLPDWEKLYEEIPKEKITAEFNEQSLISKFLCSFDEEENSDPEEKAKLNMVYQLIHDPNFSTPNNFRKVMKRIQDL